MNQRKPLEEFTPDEWRTLMAANLDGPFLVTRALLPAMKARRRGKIINICSLATDLGRPNIVPYAASKGALRMLTRALAVELAPSQHPGERHRAGILQDRDECAADRRRGVLGAGSRARTPAGRWGEPPEIAGAAVFLASAAADYVTGHVLYVDGGFSAAY